jgi:hypothetical protein
MLLAGDALKLETIEQVMSTTRLFGEEIIRHLK